MKLISSFSAVTAIVAFALTFAFDQHSVDFYSIAFGASLVLIAAGDYSPRAHRWEPRGLVIGNPAPARRAQNLRLAA
jgi:hypothetical protein